RCSSAATEPAAARNSPAAGPWQGWSLWPCTGRCGPAARTPSKERVFCSITQERTVAADSRLVRHGRMTGPPAQRHAINRHHEHLAEKYTKPAAERSTLPVTNAPG